MINSYKKIYFLGIGGIGMSALALYFSKNNFVVSGYDLFENSNCINLQKIGIKINYDENIINVDNTFLDNKNTLIIYTPAIPKENKILKYFQENGFNILKRAQVLGMISHSLKTIAIAGTHGKTSVSTQNAWIMSESEIGCNAFLGGISKNFKSNLHVDNSSNFAVVEADEFDRSFLNLNPFISLITCIEEDHLDIYNNYQNICDAFLSFLNLTNDDGYIVVNEKIDLNMFPSITSSAKLYRYSTDNQETDFYLKNIKYKNDCCVFDFVYPSGIICNMQSSLGGNHNLENTVAAMACSVLAGVDQNSIMKSVKSYQGVKRRFDIRIKTDSIIYIDDYAHHPSEITATINAVKKIYKDKEITAVFQPHLFSRTKDFADEFASALSLVDKLYLLPIYPAREKPLDGVSSKTIADICKAKIVKLCSKDEVLNDIKNQKIDLLLTMGAGDIDSLVEPISKILTENA
jgi:UDP-N-acetylmuramate--alanine ligase